MNSWYPVHASHEPNVNTKILNYAALPIIVGKFDPKYSAHAQSEQPTSHYFTFITANRSSLPPTYLYRKDERALSRNVLIIS